MGVYNSFVMDVTVPADAVGPLAADLRKEMTAQAWYPEDEIASVGDADLVAWALFAVEGASDDYGSGLGPEFTEALGALQEDGSVVVRFSGYGKIGFDSDKIEYLYAAAGTRGTIQCVLDEGITGRYILVFGDGRVKNYEVVTVFPETDAQETAAHLFAEFISSGGGRMPEELVAALAAVAAEEGARHV